MCAISVGALERFSKNIASEWGERGIRSNYSVAGFMETDMSSTLPDNMKDKIVKRRSTKKPTELCYLAVTIGNWLFKKIYYNQKRKCEFCCY